MNLEELLARLGDEADPLTDDELAELEAGLVEAFDAERDADSPSLESLTELRDHIAAVRAEGEARETARAEQATQIAQLAEQVHPPEPAPEEETPDPEASETPPEGEGEGEGETPPETPAEETPEETPAAEPAPEAVAAAAPAAPARRRVPQNLRPRPRQPARDEVVITAAGDVPGFSAGSQYPGIDAVGEAFAAKAEAMLRSGRGGAEANVATFRTPPLPAERMLHGNDAKGNTAKMDAVVASMVGLPLDEYESLVAAGGLCAPAAPSYDMVNVSTAGRPIFDSLPRFGSDVDRRGAVTFIPPPELEDLTGAIGVWTEATDTTPGGATKPCLTITCANATTVEIDAITLCLQIGNFSRRTFPEQFATWFAIARAAHARRAENKLWDRMCTLSTAVTGMGDVLGAARDVLVAVARSAAGTRSRHRMAPDATIEMWAPAWLLDLMVADLTRQLPGDNAINTSREEIEGYLRSRNILPHWALEAGLDQVFGIEAGGALQNWPTTVEVILAHPGAFAAIDGGVLDLGTEIRDSTLISTNDVRAFLESFENVGFRGVEAQCLTLNVCPSGETAATADTSAVCTSGS